MGGRHERRPAGVAAGRGVTRAAAQLSRIDTPQPCPGSIRLGTSASARQPRGRFRQHGPGQDEERSCWHGGHQEHAAPRARVGGQGQPSDEGDQNAGADGELVDGAQHASLLGRRDFRDVERHDAAGDSDTEAGHQAAEQQGRRAAGQAAQQRTQCQRHRCEAQRLGPAIRVRDRAARKTARAGACQDCRDNSALHRRAVQRKLRAEWRQSRVHNCQVVAKQKRAQGSNQDKGQHPSEGDVVVALCARGRVQSANSGGLHVAAVPCALDHHAQPPCARPGVHCSPPCGLPPVTGTCRHPSASRATTSGTWADRDACANAAAQQHRRDGEGAAWRATLA